MQQLAKFGREQQEELVQQQEQLQRSHDHLFENSKSILAAQVCFLFNLHLSSNPVTCVSSQISNWFLILKIQFGVMQEAFEQKQATMFLALDKLFTLHNALLLESRLIKAAFMYSISIFILYMLTSTKPTYNVRPQLYIGRCICLCTLKYV